MYYNVTLRCVRVTMVAMAKAVSLAYYSDCALVALVI